MTWYVPVYEVVVRLAVGSLPLLAIATIVAVCVHQPARRIRWIECTLVSCLALFPLSLAPGLPSWSLPLVRTTATAAAIVPELPHPGSRIRENSGPNRLVPPDFSRSQLQPIVATPGPLAPSPEHRSPPFDPRLLIAVAYLSGLGLMAAWWLTGMIGLRRVVRSARLADERCQTILRAVAGPTGRGMRLLVSSRVAQPFTFGWRRPVIVLPEALVAADERALWWALAHEWSHVARGDVRSWSLAGVARMVLFYQPLVWWLRGQLRLAQDYLADAAAAEQEGAEDYAEFLTCWATHRRRPVYGLGIMGSRSELSRRVIMLVERRRPLAPRSSRGWTIFAVLFAMALAVAAGTYRGGASETAADPQKAVTKIKIKKPNELAAVQRSDVVETKRGANEAPQRKRQLRYAGRDFDDWRNQLLNDLEPKTRTKAIQALQSFGKNGYGEEAAEAIGQALPSDVDSVSISAANALAAIGAPALPVLVEALKSDRASCRHHAAIAIGQIGPAAVSSADALAKLCSDDDRSVRREAAQAIARIGYQSDALTPLLSRLVADDDSSTRYGVVQGLAGMLSTSPRPLSLLLIASHDPDSNIRTTAATALAQHGPPTDEVIEALKRLVHDPKGQVGINAVIALCQSPDRDQTVVPVLADVLLSLDLMEQLSKIGVSERVIEKLRDPGDAVAIAVPALAKYIEPGFDPQKIRRVVKAIDALGELGPAAKDAIPALEAWTNGKQGVNFDNGDSMEKHARRALEKIQGEAPGTGEPDPKGARR